VIRIETMLRQAAVIPIRAYRVFVSPFLPPACRFEPSCSEYAIEAVVVHGIPRGAWLALRRILRCHPWSKAGVDQVPEALG
jgi:putative membrane protein insertion efficiency factor